MENLPRRARLVIEMQSFGGMRKPEIADRVGVSRS